MPQVMKTNFRQVGSFGQFLEFPVQVVVVLRRPLWGGKNHIVLLPPPRLPFHVLSPAVRRLLLQGIIPKLDGPGLFGYLPGFLMKAIRTQLQAIYSFMLLVFFSLCQMIILALDKNN
jgi:hypothetical protein